MIGESYDLVFDDRWIGPHGIGRFAREVAMQLPRHETLPTGGQPTDPSDPWRVGRYVNRRRPQLYFTPGFNPPLRCRVPFVMTLHDLIHLDVPGAAGRVRRAYYQHLVRPAVCRAAAVLTVSQHARTRIAEWANMPEERIIVVGNGVDRRVFRPGGPVAGDGRPYIFWIGNPKPHKNAITLMLAFARAALPDDVQLVMAGTGRMEFERLIARHAGDRADRVRHLGTIDDDELASWYRGAMTVVVPSFAEGFGLPAAEALACGAPLISSHATALPEVVGDAALLFDPGEPDELAAALVRLANDDQLRARLSVAGPIQVEPFQWDEVGRRVRAALDGCLAESMAV